MPKPPDQSSRGAEHMSAAQTIKQSVKQSLPKRFYGEVGIAAVGSGYAIQLDGRGVRTPAGKDLALPTRALGDAVVQEWRAQGDVIDPVTMPLTKLSNTAIDGVAPNRQAVIEDIAHFSTHDAICYRAENPTELVRRQGRLWDPILTWAETNLGVRWVCAGGVMPVSQPPEAVAAVVQALANYDPFPLTALHELTTLTRSALLALAYGQGALTFDALWQAANVDEDWQIERWGEDEQAQVRARDRLAAARASDRLFKLSGGC